MMHERQWKVSIYLTKRELDAAKRFVDEKLERLRDDPSLAMGLLRRLCQMADACKPAIVNYPNRD